MSQILFDKQQRAQSKACMQYIKDYENYVDGLLAQCILGLIDYAIFVFICTALACQVSGRKYLDDCVGVHTMAKNASKVNVGNGYIYYKGCTFPWSSTRLNT